MSETNPPSPSSPDEPVNPAAPQQPPGATPPEPVKKTRRRRRWPWMIGGFFVFLILVAVLAPTLLSIGPAKSMVLGVVNGELNGKIEVASWSLGWNSGITVNGLKLYDEQNKLILQASRVRTGLSLWKVLTSNGTELALGRTDVDNLELTDVHLDAEGTPNVAKVAKGKKKAKPAPSSNQPMHISGDIHVNNLTGVVTAAGVPQRLRINPSNLSVVLTGLNDPIKNDGQLVFSVEDPTSPTGTTVPGTIALAGTADLFDQDKLHLDTATAKEDLTLTNVNLAAANPFLAASKLSLAGLANGTVNVNLQGMSNAAATGEVKVADFVASGDALKGDQFKSNLSIPIKVTRAVEGNVVVLKVDDVRLMTDYGYVAVNADVSQEALQRLADGEAPGREGHVSMVAHFEQAAKLINNMPKTLQLVDGVTIDSAKVFAQLDGWLFADRVVGKAQFNLADVSGTSKGGKVALGPVTSTVDVTYAPAKNRPFTIAEVRDVGVALESAFARLDGGTGKGGTLARFTLTGNGDFAKLQQQLGQFVDLGGMSLQGAWTLKASTDGDPSVDNAAIKTNAQFTATNLVVKGLAGLPPIAEPWLNATAAGDLHLKDNAPQSITGGDVTVRSNNPNQPTIDLHATGDLDLKTFASSKFDVSVKAALAKARDEFAAVVPALNYFESGQLNASGAGSYDGSKLILSTDRPLAVKVTGLSVRQSPAAKSAVVLKDQSLDAGFAGVVTLSDDEVSADVKSLSVTAPQLLDLHKRDGALTLRLVKQPKQQITGTGGLDLSADAKRLADLYKSFSPAPAGQPDKGVGELAKGLLKGSVTFARADQPVTTVDGNFTVDVSVTSAKQPINDTIAITLNARAPDDLTQPMPATATVKSNLLNASLADAVVVLAHATGANQATAFNGAFDLLRSAKLTLTADRLDALQAIYNGLMPPTLAPPAPAAAAVAQVSAKGRKGAPEPEPVAADDVEAAKPLPPLQILGGRVALAANVSRDGQVTTLKDTTLDVTKLKFQRGDGYYDAGDRVINLKLAAAVETTPTSAIQRIEVRDLSGDLAAGKLTMTKPIVVTQLAGSPAVNGGVELRGQLGDALRMLEAYQGAKAGTKYPYAGDYVLAQTFTSQADTTQLAGSLKATKFTAYDPANPKQVTFSEDQLSLTNDVSADVKTATATIRDFSLNMQSTGALALTLSNGQLIDWADQRKIADKLQAKLRIDWPKFWTLVRPMLDPKTLESLKDLELAGVMDKTFTVSGSYPATGKNRRGQAVPLPMQNSLKFLTAEGGLAIDRVAASGLDVQKLDIPVVLRKGILYVSGARPITCNGGTIDLNNLQLDLTAVDPTNKDALVMLLTIPDANKKLFVNVSLNPVLAETFLGSYVNTAFSGSQKATGALDLTSVYCDRLPLGQYMKQPGNPGRAQFVMSVSAVQLKGEGIGQLTGAIGTALSAFGGGMDRFEDLEGSITDAVITIDKGKVTHKLPLKTDRLGTWVFDGNLDMASQRFSFLNMEVPTTLFNSRDLTKYAGNSITFPFSGPIKRPTLSKDFVAKFAQENLKDALPNLLGNVLNKGKDKKSKDGGKSRDAGDSRSSVDEAKPTEKANPREDAIGGLLDLAGGLLNKDKDKDKKRDDRRAMPEQRDAREPGGARDGAAPPRDIGDPPVSGSPRPAGERRGPDDVGDQRISSDPRSANPPTTAPATAPAGRKVSGRTRDARD